MFLLLGADTYVGQAFARALRRRQDAFIPLSRSAFDYARFEFLLDYVRKVKPELLINAASSPELSGHEVPESERMDVLQTNTLLPQTVSRVCVATNTPYGHLSSGSIYSGAKIVDKENSRIEENLRLPKTRELFASNPELFHGFSESDEPNFSFNAAPCTFYSGTKALAEASLDPRKHYLWRLRLPFNEQDDPANFLSQLLYAMSHGGTHSREALSRQGQIGQPATTDHDILHDAINSLSQVDECAGACLELWDRRAPYGIYNVANPGAVCNHDIIFKIQRTLKPVRPVRLVVYENNKAPNGEKTRRSDCILDVSKVLRTGIKLRPVGQAIDKALQQWETSKTATREIGNA